MPLTKWTVDAEVFHKFSKVSSLRDKVFSKSVVSRLICLNECTIKPSEVAHGKNCICSVFVPSLIWQIQSLSKDASRYCFKIKHVKI